MIRVNSYIYIALSLKSNEEEFMNEYLQGELTRRFKDNKEYMNFIPLLRFSKNNKLNLRFAITNIENAFDLEFKLQEPISFILTSKTIDQFNYLFKYLFKLMTLDMVITKLYTIIKGDRRRGDIIFHKFSKLFHRSLHLLKSFRTFLFNEVYMLYNI